MERVIWQVALPSPLHQTFDYLPVADSEPRRPPCGVRMRVPFGRRVVTGVLMGTAADTPIDAARLKTALAVLDEQPVLPAELLALAVWASDYYHYPIGEAVFTVLPAALRGGKSPSFSAARALRLTAAGRAIDSERLARRAPRQADLLRRLAKPSALGHDAASLTAVLRPALLVLLAKGWIEECAPPPLLSPPPVISLAPAPTLNALQQAAVEEVLAGLGRFHTYLLDGVTGSGKTEVYLHAAAAVVESGGQALILAPEIGLTPQLAHAFRQRFGDAAVAVLHSGLTPRARLRAWRDAASTRARLVIGTRSAVFTPLPALRLIVVDEEHDLSFKQADGLRYHARDVAVIRAKLARVPVLLGSATPSLESLHNAERQRYRHLRLPARIAPLAAPPITVVDLRRRKMEEGIATDMLTAVERHLSQQGQVLLFLNQRGFAPSLLCHDCGWTAVCRHCDARMVLHRAVPALHCHHCGAQRRPEPCCPSCGSVELRPLGAGTERIEQFLQQRFPGVTIARIDRDNTRAKGKLYQMLEEARSGRTRLLVGTQMLAKGHHFPAVTLVGILNADQGLYSADFRAAERMAQTVVQVMGRAGRADRPSEVYLQTHQPEHPLLRLLITHGYHAFARAALAERQAARLPPFSALALLRAEAPQPDNAHRFLLRALKAAEQIGAAGVRLFGPVPAALERRAGYHRAVLLAQAARRAQLHEFLSAWSAYLQPLKSGKQVRFALDVDPLELL